MVEDIIAREGGTIASCLIEPIQAEVGPRRGLRVVTVLARVVVLCLFFFGEEDNDESPHSFTREPYMQGGDNHASPQFFRSLRELCKKVGEGSVPEFAEHCTLTL